MIENPLNELVSTFDWYCACLFCSGTPTGLTRLIWRSTGTSWKKCMEVFILFNAKNMGLNACSNTFFIIKKKIYYIEETSEQTSFWYFWGTICSMQWICYSMRLYGLIAVRPKILFHIIFLLYIFLYFKGS